MNGSPRDGTGDALTTRPALIHEPLVDNLAHALRSSLNGIRAWAGLLDERQDTATASPIVARAIAGIHAGVDEQVALIDALCDAYDVLGHRVHVHRTPMRVRPALDAALASVRRAADDKGIDLELAIDLVDETVVGDSRRVVQIFTELLRNAVKFTPAHGRIDVTAGIEHEHVVVAVADPGPGLATGFEDWLFDPLRRSDPDHAIVGAGLGLGLAVTKALVLLHDGTIEARSAGPGAGTTLTIALPVSD